MLNLNKKLIYLNELKKTKKKNIKIINIYIILFNGI